jgi:hypothetical protein
MKHLFALLLLISPFMLRAQKPDAAYVKALYQKYPTQKSDLCPSCKLWVNPYYKAVADTLKHTPLLTYYVYTKAHRLEQESAGVPRTGIYAAWHAAFGQPDETVVYREANRIIGKPNSSEMIAKGHCQAWILLAWCADGAILSDTYTFNAGMEFQGQNVGTEIATEELCRKLTGYKRDAITDSVKIWCGTFGSLQTYTKNGMTVTVPSHYYKVIAYHDNATGSDILLTYWMPNDPKEKKLKLKDRMITYPELVAKLGFNPQRIFN